jgi:hypothetical protein
LILDYEVGGGAGYYNRFLSHPTWPGVSSGVTIGMGYDLGYNAKAAIVSDWSALPGADLQRLADCAGITGRRALARLHEVRDILIRWDIALPVFNEVTLSRFYALAKNTFPNFEQLPPDCRAALVSLVFNRGSSMYGDSRREMRAIRDLCSQLDTANLKLKTLPGIAGELEKMCRLWPDVPGLVKRRKAEAALVRSCL